MPTRPPKLAVIAANRRAAAAAPEGGDRIERSIGLRTRPETQRALCHYVYAYYDPRDNKPFYIGKGFGGRVHAHESGRANLKTQEKIDEIRKAGKTHRIEILTHGFADSETALAVEAAAIDLIGQKNLTNQVRGWGSVHYGRRTLEELNLHYSAPPAKIVHPVLLIRINQLFDREKEMTEEELYEATRGVWKLGVQREKAKYVLPVFEGVVREVYEVEKWHPAGTTPYRTRKREDVHYPGRCEFVGRKAPADVRERYFHKRVDDYFDKRGQNPLRYVECD